MTAIPLGEALVKCQLTLRESPLRDNMSLVIIVVVSYTPGWMGKNVFLKSRKHVCLAMACKWIGPLSSAHCDNDLVC